MEQAEVKASGAGAAFERQWHHRPRVPIQVSPFFSWPPDVKRMWRWLAGSWFTITENTILLALAFACWTWFQPALEDAKSFTFGWIAQMYVRNFVLLLIVAGGLHLYFFTWKKQGQELKFDKRDLARESRGFSFGNQVADNMFWSLGAGVAFWTAYEALMFWAMANGYAPVLTWSDNPVWFVMLFLLTPIWISFHFYWVHRWMHWPPLYRISHALHHRNTKCGPMVRPFHAPGGVPALLFLGADPLSAGGAPCAHPVSHAAPGTHSGHVTYWF